MTKAEFLKKFKTDYTFRAECKFKGIRVIGNNVIFLNPDGTIKYIAGAYIK